MLKIIPSYLNDPSAPAKNILEELKNVNIKRYDIIKVTDLNSSEISALQEKIKLATTKTANIKEAVVVKVRFYGTTLNASGQTVEKNSEVDLTLIKV